MEPAEVFAPNAVRFAPLEPHQAAAWANFGRWPGRVYLPGLLGLVVEELRTDYARMRLPWRDDLAQPAEVMHGGALATLIDTVVVPAIGTAYATVPAMFTLSMNVNYLAAVRRGEDAVAEGWVEQRGRTTVFCRAEVHTSAARLAATGTLVYQVRPTA